MMWNEVLLRQLLLITDGCSNAGKDPVVVAQVGRDRGYVTSVIGILDDGALGENGRREAQNIAAAGGGMCRIVHAADLSHTMQMVTRQTMQIALHEVINAELRQIVGGESDALPPDTRTKVAHFVDTLTEEAPLDLALVVDVSASMADKMAAVREAVRDLEVGLTARAGTHRLVVVTYPGRGGEPAFVHEGVPDRLAETIGAIRAAGNTPTGSALEEAMRALSGRVEGDVVRTGGRGGEEVRGRTRHRVV